MRCEWGEMVKYTWLFDAGLEWRVNVHWHISGAIYVGASVFVVVLAWDLFLVFRLCWGVLLMIVIVACLYWCLLFEFVSSCAFVVVIFGALFVACRRCSC